MYVYAHTLSTLVQSLHEHKDQKLYGKELMTIIMKTGADSVQCVWVCVCVCMHAHPHLCKATRVHVVWIFNMSLQILCGAQSRIIYPPTECLIVQGECWSDLFDPSPAHAAQRHNSEFSCLD